MTKSEQIDILFEKLSTCVTRADWLGVTMGRNKIMTLVQEMQRDIEGLAMMINEPRQQKLDKLGETIIDLNDQLNDGLITINEYLGRMTEIATNTEQLDLAGLRCPITGFNYPTESEINAIDRRMK